MAIPEAVIYICLLKVFPNILHVATPASLDLGLIEMVKPDCGAYSLRISLVDTSFCLSYRAWFAVTIEPKKSNICKGARVQSENILYDHPPWRPGRRPCASYREVVPFPTFCIYINSSLVGVHRGQPIV